MPPLPFNETADVLAQGGDVVPGGEAIPCSTPWKAAGASRSGRTGKTHTHTAQAPSSAYDLLDEPNRKLRVDGTTYAVVDVTRHDFLPHVEIELRRVKGG